MKNILKKKTFLLVIASICVVLAVVAGFQINSLNTEIREKFDGKRWSLPAVVYARALEIYQGMKLTPQMLTGELLLAGYRQEEFVRSAGGFRLNGDVCELISRDFVFPDGVEKSKSLHITFADGYVQRIVLQSTGEELPLVRLDPARIGSFHPLVHEDRLVLDHEQIPELLRRALIAVEDKKFLTHHGIAPLSIGRALLANLKAGRTVQGGSTLTQQLVKNFFLGRQQTLSRKIQEAVMAVLLEYHYPKDEILTAYINEVFLGQDGRRAIHGFGLASQFYFRRSLVDLSVAQIATLVGMVKGPSFYDPRKNTEKCLSRREIVLRIMLADGVIDEAAFKQAVQQPLLDVAPQKGGFNRFPAFVELVRRQLGEEYREEDLKGNGLRILTTLDPRVQIPAEKQLTKTLAALDKKDRSGKIEGALVITARESGEVQAIVGGREPHQYGFNRALDARRAIGSLIKPAIYLAALEDGYTLASSLEDRSIVLENEGSSWSPKNYDRKEHGRVALYEALAHSYNLATVRLGTQVGIPRVLEILAELGHTESLKPYPSILLGAVSMSPLQVTQMYQTIASGGFYLPLRSIQAVIASDGKLLKRYGLEVEQHFSAETMYLLNHALMRVMSEGTGKTMYNPFKRSFAGKTGTTNNLQDSWFAGYCRERLAVVWLGNDDNRSISLTGSSGALLVWSKVMEALDAQSLDIPEPEGIIWRRIDRVTLQPTHILNRNSTVLPFDGESASSGSIDRIEDTARKVMESIKDLVK